MNSVTKLLLASACLVSLAACTYQHTAERTAVAYEATGMSGKTQIERSGTWVLDPSSSIYVAMPRSDGKATSLQEQLSMNLGRGLERNFARVKLGSSALSLDAALQEARRNNCAYLMFPRLMAIKDGMSTFEEFDEAFYGDERSYGLDRLALQVQVYDAMAGTFLDRINIESQGSWLPVNPGSPADLMKATFEEMSALLVGHGQ